MNKKVYALEVQPLHDLDNGELVSYYSKGHHDPAAFVEAVYRDYGDEYPVETVEHAERRWEIVCGPDGWCRCLNTPHRGRRGVFPVTIIDWS